jgi:hypothetical protein
VLESTVLKIAVRLLSSEIATLRSAACQVIRSLSRSVKNLRTHLVDANIVGPVIRLLSESEETVLQTAACATLCNLVLDFSPMKQAVLDSGAVDRIVALLREKDVPLRLNAVWAIKNLLYMADAKTKRSVMDRMSFDLLHALTLDPELDVQTQALNILRNLACGEDSVHSSVHSFLIALHAQDILQILQGFGTTRLLGLVLDKLRGERRDIIVQVLKGCSLLSLPL